VMAGEVAAPALPAPPKQARTSRMVLSADAQWLAIVEDAKADAKWLHWWRLNNAATQWIAVGRWRVPSESQLLEIAFTGDRIVVAHGVGGAWHLADIPLWPHARAVQKQALGQGVLQNVAPLPDGRGAGLKFAGQPWQWHVLD